MEQLERLVGAELGRGAPVIVEVVAGGTDKRVFRARLPRGTSVIVHHWPSEPREPSSAQHDVDQLFLPRSTPRVFLQTHRLFEQLGVRVPHLLTHDRSGRWIEGEVAVVEDVGDRDLSTVISDEPKLAVDLVRELAGVLELVHASSRLHWGHLDVQAAADQAADRSSAWDVVARRALRDLREAADRRPTLRAVRDRVEQAVSAATAAIEPRPTHRLIHGELGPEHVLVSPTGEVVLIDVEGATYFDVEWEHAWLALRYGDLATHLRAPVLDERRLELATLGLHLSYIAGPLRLLDSNAGDASALRAIVSHHEEALVRAMDSSPAPAT